LKENTGTRYDEERISATTNSSQTRYRRMKYRRASMPGLIFPQSGSI
jgi:hypothetical protein